VGQRRRSLPLRISGGDRHEAESGGRRDQWCMERGTTQAVANESDAEWRRLMSQLKRPLCGLVGICWSCVLARTVPCEAEPRSTVRHSPKP
jgi:hypothetical protein